VSSLYAPYATSSLPLSDEGGRARSCDCATAKLSPPGRSLSLASTLPENGEG
jgi:hypothetical protein